MVKRTSLAVVAISTTGCEKGDEVVTELALAVYRLDTSVTGFKVIYGLADCHFLTYVFPILSLIRFTLLR